MILTFRKALRQLCYTYSTFSVSSLRFLEPYWRTVIWVIRVPYPDSVFSMDLDGCCWSWRRCQLACRLQHRKWNPKNWIFFDICIFKQLGFWSQYPLSLWAMDLCVHASLPWAHCSSSCRSSLYIWRSISRSIIFSIILEYFLARYCRRSFELIHSASVKPPAIPPYLAPWVVPSWCPGVSFAGIRLYTINMLIYIF